MKGISAAIIVTLMSAGNIADAAIRCQETPGRDGVYWSWREIDGKRCWFMREGNAIPPKSAFTWAKEEPARKDNSAPSETAPSIQMLRVKPAEDGFSDVRANWLDDAPVDLIVGEDLSGSFGVGGNWVIPTYAATGQRDDLFREAFHDRR